MFVDDDLQGPFRMMEFGKLIFPGTQRERRRPTAMSGIDLLFEHLFTGNTRGRFEQQQCEIIEPASVRDRQYEVPIVSRELVWCEAARGQRHDLNLRSACGGSAGLVGALSVALSNR